MTGVTLLVAAGCEPGPVKSKGNLRVGISEFPLTLDPRFANDRVSKDLCSLIFNGLVKLDDKYNPVCDLAESWEKTTDEIYIFRIRKSIFFHHGEQLNAEDVVYTFKTILDPLMQSPLRRKFRFIKEVKLLDPYTVAFILEEPFANFVSTLTQGIVPRKYAIALSPNFGRRPSGTGPFRFGGWEKNRLNLEAFSAYGTEAPRLNQISFEVTGESDQAKLLISKNLDFTRLNPVSTPLDAIMKNRGVQIQSDQFSRSHFLGLNLMDDYLRRRYVRYAINLVIDRNRIVLENLGGMGLPAKSLLPPDHWAYAENLREWKLDRAKAASLLDKINLRDPDGNGPKNRFALELIVRRDIYEPSIVDALKNDFKSISVDLDVKVLGDAEFRDRLNEGKFQIFYDVMEDISNPDFYYERFYSQKTPFSGENYVSYWNPQVDKILEKIRTTVNREDNIYSYRDIQEILYADLPYIYLWYSHNMVARRNNVKNYKFSPMGDFYSFRDVSLK